jgi:diguanylate cyclase (GGDEF)-like protein
VLVIALCAVWLAMRRPVGGRLPETLEAIDARLAGLDERVNAVLRRTTGPDETLGTAIGETLDLTEVLQRTLAAAEAVGGVDGGRISVRLGDGQIVTQARGLAGLAATPDGPPDGSPYTLGIMAWQVEGDGLRSGCVVPLVQGSLAVYSTRSNAFDENDAATLRAIAQRAEPAVRNALAYLKVQQEAATDLLTGLGSNRAFEEALPRAIDAARRHGRPLCLVGIDLDRFGEINKRHSQEVGNTTLAEFARRLKATIRGSDAAYRLSGGADEFFLILPETNRTAAQNLYARLTFEMRAEQFPVVGTVTMSSGLVELRDDDTTVSLKERADALVRDAKAGGGDHVLSDGAP